VDSVRTGCPLSIAGISSTASVTGLCQEGGTRLFDAAAQLALEPPHPSPGNGLVQLRFRTIENGMTSLTLYDVRGRAVRRILHEALQRRVLAAACHTQSAAYAAVRRGEIVRGFCTLCA
jgi:hypothetical protein